MPIVFIFSYLTIGTVVTLIGSAVLNFIFGLVICGSVGYSLVPNRRRFGIVGGMEKSPKPNYRGGIRAVFSVWYQQCISNDFFNFSMYFLLLEKNLLLPHLKTSKLILLQSPISSSSLTLPSFSSTSAKIKIRYQDKIKIFSHYFLTAIFMVKILQLIYQIVEIAKIYCFHHLL